MSTPAQAKADRAGIDTQRAAILEYSARNGLEIRAEYVDEVSGASDNRPDFYRLLADSYQFGAVAVFHLDRVGRDEEISHRYLRLMHEAGLQVHATNSGLVTRGFMTSIEIAVSAEERRKIAARLMGAKIHIAKERQKIPQGIQLFAYRHVGREAFPVPEEAAIVRRIFELSASGLTFRAIETLLNAEGVPTPGRLRKGTQNPWLRTLGWPLVGYLYCGWCGHRLSSGRSDKATVAERARGLRYYWEHYVCNSKTIPGKNCGLPRQSRARLEVAVDTELRRTLSDEGVLREMFAAAEERRPGTDPQVAALEAEDAGWLEAFRAKAITAAELRSYRADIAERLRALRTPVVRDVPVEKYRRLALEDDLGVILRESGARVTVTPGEVAIALG